MLKKSFHVDWCSSFWVTLFANLSYKNTVPWTIFPSGNSHIMKRSIKFKIFIHNPHTRACSWISGELISYVMKSCVSFAFPHLLHKVAPLILLHNFCLKFVDLVPNPRTHLISVEITCYAREGSELWWFCVSPGAHFPGYSNTAAAPMPVPMHMDTTPYALKQTTRATKKKEQDSSGLHHPRKKIKIKNTINLSFLLLSCFTRRAPGNSGSKRSM